MEYLSTVIPWIEKGEAISIVLLWSVTRGVARQQCYMHLFRPREYLLLFRKSVGLRLEVGSIKRFMQDKHFPRELIFCPPYLI